MPYLVVVLPHDFMGKMELLAERDTEAEARQIAESGNPYGPTDNKSAAETRYSAVVWEGTLDDAYSGVLGRPIAIYYRGKEWRGT